MIPTIYSKSKFKVFIMPICNVPMIHSFFIVINSRKHNIPPPKGKSKDTHKMSAFFKNLYTQRSPTLMINYIFLIDNIHLFNTKLIIVDNFLNKIKIPICHSQQHIDIFTHYIPFKSPMT